MSKITKPLPLDKMESWTVSSANRFMLDLHYKTTLTQADWVKLLAEVNKLADFVTNHINEANQTVLDNAFDWGANVALPEYNRHALVIERTLTVGDIKE